MEPMMELSEEKRRQLEEEFKQLKGLLSRGSGDYCNDIQSQKGLKFNGIGSENTI
jgi:hypothetical protein